MRGDRDGNSNITNKMATVALLARWMAADLYIKGLNMFRSEFSMRQYSAVLHERVGESAQPDRQV